MRVFSRIQLDIDYRTLADLISLPEGTRIVLVRKNDVKGVISLIVDGVAGEFKYLNPSGGDVVCKVINSRRDIEEGLHTDKKT